MDVKSLYTVIPMDVKSLYTVISSGDSLLVLTHFLNKRPVLQPPTHTLVRLAELVLSLNRFSFNGNVYWQTGGVAIGSRLGPNYACLFAGHVEEKSSFSTRKQNQSCAKDISCHFRQRSKILRPTSTAVIPALISPGPFRMCSCLSLTFV